MDIEVLVWTLIFLGGNLLVLLFLLVWAVRKDRAKGRATRGTDVADAGD